jgi:hypothetical protein
VDVSLDAHPVVVAHVEEYASVEAHTPELQLAVAFEVLHGLDMAEKSGSLSMEEHDLVEFLVAQVASLNSSLAVEVAGKVVVVESLDLPPVTCEVMSLRPIPVVSPAPFLRSWIHRSLGRRPPPPSFKVKAPDLAALVTCQKGAIFMCSC